MQCSCGNEMRDHKIQRNRQIVAEYKRCIAKESRGCGRVLWIWAGPEIDRTEYPRAPEFVTEVEK